MVNNRWYRQEIENCQILKRFVLSWHNTGLACNPSTANLNKIRLTICNYLFLIFFISFFLRFCRYSLTNLCWLGICFVNDHVIDNEIAWHPDLSLDLFPVGESV